MTTKVTEETRKEKKSTPEKMLGWFILAPVLLIAVALIIAAWPEDSQNEVPNATPVVAKRVESHSVMPTYGCGENVFVVAPVGRWSRGAPQRSGCDFYFLRDPLLDGSASDRRKNWHGLITVRINGKGGPEMHSGRLSDGRLVSAYFEELVDTMAFRSEENYPVYIILKYLQK